MSLCNKNYGQFIGMHTRTNGEIHLIFFFFFLNESRSDFGEWPTKRVEKWVKKQTYHVKQDPQKHISHFEALEQAMNEAISYRLQDSSFFQMKRIHHSLRIFFLSPVEVLYLIENVICFPLNSNVISNGCYRLKNGIENRSIGNFTAKINSDRSCDLVKWQCIDGMRSFNDYCILCWSSKTKNRNSNIWQCPIWLQVIKLLGD